ncbi:HNH endonuclease signature motif containing protein [uncultured Cohaesibacter sp.]|uniref:HNH endonuclease n=1 Tax=uncultured Cohaesibacter sp. TaxID=1002546 RepID=UPI002930D3B7|nr:HNH endonuclease signature motif containing protein [uncultured Cohaesibacter sp.]
MLAVLEKEPAQKLVTVREEFSKKTKAEAFLRDGGRCVKCGTKLSPDATEYDHIEPCGLGGDNSLDNCQCLCGECHKEKTKGDVKTIAKVKRIHNKHVGIETRKKQKLPSRPFPGSKQSGWKKKLDGSVERRQSAPGSKALGRQMNDYS